LVSISDGLSRRHEDHEDHEDHDAILAAELQGNADSQRDRSVGVPFDAAAMRRAWPVRIGTTSIDRDSAGSWFRSESATHAGLRSRPVVELQLDAFVTFEAS
jgi:hypothetical protein